MADIQELGDFLYLMIIAIEMSQMTALVFISFGEHYNYTWMNNLLSPYFLHLGACLHGKDIIKVRESLSTVPTDSPVHTSFINLRLSILWVFSNQKTIQREDNDNFSPPKIDMSILLSPAL